MTPSPPLLLEVQMGNTAQQQNWRNRDMAFLAMAVVAHVALLLIPLKNWERALPPPDNRLTIKLQALPTPAKPEPLLEVIPSGNPMEPVEPEHHLNPVVLEEIPPRLEVLEPPVDQAEAKEISAWELRSLVTQSESLTSKSDSSRKLGDAKEYQAPANWSRSAGAPYLEEFDNRFDGMTVPEKVEIVDRWLAADGSHNVVLNTPTGETLCGRAEAYNPMQPLVEPIMMFRSCAGGGKRTFSMPERYNKGQ